jgi:CheY-like chemotaxis protein
MTAQNMAKKILADSGYEVTTVSNGAAAVKKIAEVKPDLVILDIYMPGYTGLEVCERVRASVETSKLPVLLTVGKMEPYRPEDGARVRADGIIVKPFEATDLLGIVKKLSEKLAPSPKITPVPTESFAEEPVAENTESDYGDSKTATTVEVPAEMAVAPAMAFEDLPIAGESTPPEMDAVPHGFMPVAPVDFTFAQAESEPGIVTDSVPAYIESETSAAPVPSLELETFAPSAQPDTVSAEPEIEFTSARPAEVIDVRPVPDFEPTVQAEETANLKSEPDPALVTERDQMAQFATTFGVENAEEIPVGTVTGNEPFFETTPAAVEAPEPLKAEDFFPESTHEQLGVAEEPEPSAALISEIAEPAEEPAPETISASSAATVDDFEARVAAAMSAFDMPQESEEPIVEQVDNFVADPEIMNPIGVDETPGAPAPSIAEAEPPVAETVLPRTLNVDETMVLPAEALLSLEAEMRKAMEIKNVVSEPPAPIPVEEGVSTVEVPPEEPLGEPALPELSAEVAEPPVAEREPVPGPEPAPSFAELQESPLPTMAAAPVVPEMGSVHGFGEEKLANAVHTAMERLKPQLIAEIVKALKGE